MKGLHPGGRYLLPSGERVLAAIHLRPDEPEKAARAHTALTVDDLVPDPDPDPDGWHG